MGCFWGSVWGQGFFAVFGPDGLECRRFLAKLFARGHFSKFPKMAFFAVFASFLGGHSGVLFGGFGAWEASVADLFRRGVNFWGSVWGKWQLTGETAFWDFRRGLPRAPPLFLGKFPKFGNFRGVFALFGKKGQKTSKAKIVLLGAPNFGERGKRPFSPSNLGICKISCQLGQNLGPFGQRVKFLYPGLGSWEFWVFSQTEAGGPKS